MSSAICQNFVQNAWKKELCSNCFKSKDEHNSVPQRKPVTLISTKKVLGIIKDPKKRRSKTKLNVVFRKELTQFIGYGGDDWQSGEESDNESQENDVDLSEDDLLLTDSDEEENVKEMRKRTKENTSFNTVNLTENDLKKNTHALLMLGKPIVDSEGKKQSPLMVSVTPFGEDAPQRKFVSNKTLSSISTTKTNNNNTNNKNKENIKDNNKNVNNNNIILTSYEKNEDDAKREEKSLLDEISETLENGKNPIQIMAKRRTSKDIVLEISPSDKENITETKKEVIYEKKVSLSRTPALKLEKPSVYQTSTAKIEVLNSKNLKLNKDLNANNIKTEVNNNSQPRDVKLDVLKFINSEIKAASNELIEKNCEHQPQTREQAGKPDGSEDPESLEMPALPLNPPPVLETQNSFLHGTTSSATFATPTTPVAIPAEKPKIPSKPATVLIKRAINVAAVTAPQPAMTTFSKEPISKQNSADSDSKNNKRRAPMPPEENTAPIYTRNTQATVNTDCPVVREKEKRERASSLAPKVYTVTPTPPSPSVSPETNGVTDFPPPAPAPRRLLSVSSDNLCLIDDKRSKEKTKARFSLRKFLRMGSSKDLPRLSVDLSMGESIVDEPKPKPRLVIVHPSELNGSKVEVVATPDQADSATPIEIVPSKCTKPPPPPRNYENWKTNPTNPPPKSVEILNKQRQISRSNSNTITKKPETVYANIGEVRSSIVPNKPVRTASMREREAQQQQQQLQERTRKHHYEPIGNLVKSADHHVYDYVNGSNRSSSPESDSSRGVGKISPKSKNLRLNKRSESSIDVSGEYFKYGNIPRSVSLTYCGSETESEIYAPYSFYGSESEVTEDDHDWVQNSRTHKLRSRKGRSIVHKNLEDNYGAVVVANHEALAQVLENIQHTTLTQPALRGLKMCPNLRLDEFSVKSTVPPVSIGTKTFHQALWGANHVTLMFTTGLTTSSSQSLGSFNLHVVTEFSDLVPCELLGNMKEKDSKKQCQATIQVLPWLQIHTIESYGDMLKHKPNQEETWRDAFFVLLQVVNALKMLQAQGIEELPVSLKSFVLCKEMDRDAHFRLCVLQGLSSEITTLTGAEEKYGTLCTCAARALSLLQPPSKTSTLLQSLLSNERSVSLTQVKSILEFSLWGPSDVSLGSTVKERELTLQRWLDLQRATVLHGLVCARVQLTVYEECHLLFLVRSNARMMSDASMLIDSNNLKYCHSSKA